ncbi:hypothetical protein BCR39DRAFT_535837 [Naematelia encephala]|uniref:Uncharacterized protein n=1 Tax=Naematelia encephala TaxID=71784 RepID=A0A1Y2B0A1_9TREE|nr:hypothetical protein BCR39DRAFT_535837 [Naematelia encephala]
MNQTIDEAKTLLETKEGREELQNKTGINPQSIPSGDLPSSDNSGAQPGQFGQEGQYGAVTGKGFGFGAGLAKDKDGNPLQGENVPTAQAGPGQSNYEGYEAHDTTASGGYGKNNQGDPFSRANQMNADKGKPIDVDDDSSDEGHGYKTGTSTPGYRQEGDVDAEAAENRMRNANLNTYGQQADDRGAKGNDYNEAI